jgi:hypothetical protein
MDTSDYAIFRLATNLSPAPCSGAFVSGSVSTTEPNRGQRVSLLPMLQKPRTVARSHFRSPDGHIRIARVSGGTPATHAVFCKRASGDGWFLTRAYKSQEAAAEAIAAINPAWVSEVDYVIVESEPF